MAYFERADERDKLILCNICNVKCNERSITSHKAVCSTKPNHVNKFKKGELATCKYDSGHIVKGNMMDLHLEFCTKYQNQLVGEYQHANMKIERSIEPAETLSEPGLSGDPWNREANSDHYINELTDKTKKMSLHNKSHKII